MTTMAQQAVKGLRVSKDGNVVMVNDHADRWLCWREEWEAALERLGEQDAAKADDADDQVELDSAAYVLLCREVRGPVASVIGSSHGGDIGPLVREAVSLGMIEESTARNAYGVEVVS